MPALTPLDTILETLYKYARYIYPGAQEPKTHTFSDVEHCLQILACNTFDGERNQANRLASRAIPNQRLVEAFGIDNAFTTEDDIHAKYFKNQAMAMINSSNINWQVVGSLAQKIIRKGITRPDGEFVRTELDCLVQSLALKVAIHVLFRTHNPLDLDDHEIENMATAINDLWVFSKGQHSQRDIQKAKQTLRNSLFAIFPDYHQESDPRDNPLNFIIPAYETLWRVVLFCLIEVNFRAKSAAQLDDWRHVLQQYINQVTQGGFEEPAARTIQGSVSVEDIVNEALRLYTPTRRIHRHYNLPSYGASVILAADIEALHRNPDIFGDDPLTFNPARWHSLNENAHKAFMPFGNKPFLCPAQKVFGPRIIGVLVAALTTGIDPAGWKLRYRKDGEVKVFGDDEVLETNRGAYASWVMTRKDGLFGEAE